MEFDLSKAEWKRVLNEIGRITSGRYNQNLYFGAGSYHLGLLKNALKYKVTNDLQIAYKIDTGEEKLDQIALYFEYGTGIYNVKYKKQYIKPKNQEYMKFKNKKGKWITTKNVAGVKAIFPMTKAIKSVANEWDLQIQRAIKRLGIR